MKNSENLHAKLNSIVDSIDKLVQLANIKGACAASIPTRIFRDRGAWRCVHGANMVSGICGIGNTPRESVEDFEKKMNQKGPNSAT